MRKKKVLKVSDLLDKKFNTNPPGDEKQDMIAKGETESMKESKDCPKCKVPMQKGVSHDSAYHSQYECRHCGHIEPVKESVDLSESLSLLSRSKTLLNILTEGTSVNSTSREQNLFQYKSYGNEITPIGKVTLIPKLEPSIYEVTQTMTGVFFSKKDILSDELLRFEDSRYNKVMEEVNKFWGLHQRFSEFGFSHKRGILLYGDPGTGKSCLLKQIMDEAVAQSTIVLVCKSISAMKEGIKSIREIEKDTNILAVIEDIDEYRYDEHAVLQLFDGNDQVDRVLYLATTNYIDRLPARILRPGRFDTKMEVVNPPASGRRAYFVHKLPAQDSAYIERLVNATDDFSFAELREFLVSLCCYGGSIESTVQKVKTGSINSVTEAHDPNNIANNPPKFVQSHHHTIWKALVLKNKHTSYGAAVNHFKRHVFKHGTFGADKLAKMSLGQTMVGEGVPGVEQDPDDKKPESYSDHKLVSNFIRSRMIRYRSFGKNKSALANDAKSHKVSSRLSKN